MRRFLRNQLGRVKQVWGDANIWVAGERRHWLQHPLVQERINWKITGDRNLDRFQYFLNRYLKDRLPVENALTLGCGSGDLERGLSQYKFAKNHDAIDLSDDAIRSARQQAAEAGLSHIRYRVAELNSVQLQPDRYDVIFAISSAHHVAKLEHLYEQVQSALRRGGYFFLDEYIGPSQFQWADEQLLAMNAELKSLPEKLRRRVSEPPKIKREVIRKTIEHMNTADPSEAIRSAEIVPLLSRYFQVLEFRGYGGSLLHELLYDITGNFDEGNPGSLELLRRLFQVEDDLIAGGRLQHDFAVIIATR